MSPHAVTDLARPASIEGPADPKMAQLWHLAVAKFEARELRQPATREEWRAITRDYRRLLDKLQGSIAQVLEHRCAEAPGGD